MSQIRVVGRSKHGRCVFCHDDLAGEEVSTCPGCHATWHQDCRAESNRCSTNGCAHPAPVQESRRGRRRRRRARAAVPAAAATPPTFRRRATTRRGEAISEILSSALFTGLFMLAAAAWLSWPLLDLNHFAELALSTRKGDAGIVLLAVTMFSLFIFARSLWWLVHLPGVLREVNHLLDSTEPTLMRLTVRKRVTTNSKGHASTRWGATLEGGEPVTRLDFSLEGMLPPGWLRTEELKNAPVLVYGLPPPGPYLIELEDGRLAVVNP